MFGAVNAMMLDVLAAVARKDYEDRRRRVAQGQAKAKAEGRYRGRPEDTAQNARIARMLNAALSWSQIQDTLHCSRGTAPRVASRPSSSLFVRVPVLALSVAGVSTRMGRASGGQSRVPWIARDSRAQVHVIITAGADATRVAKEATAIIPIPAKKQKFGRWENIKLVRTALKGSQIP